MLNTLPPCVTAAAGTEFARDFLFYIACSLLCSPHLFWSALVWVQSKAKQSSYGESLYSIKRNMGYDDLPSPAKKGGVIWFYHIPKAEMHDQAFAHCQIFFTAAAVLFVRMGRVPVPLWPFPRSGRLWIFGLVPTVLTRTCNLRSQLPNPNRKTAYQRASL